MKKLHLIFGLFFLFSFQPFIFAQDISMLDNDNAFLGIRFGQERDSIKRILTPVPTGGDETKHEELYKVIKKQYYGLGVAKFKEFTINFWEDKVDNMYIDLDAENGPIMLQELESIYGKATKSGRNAIYSWNGHKAAIQMIMNANGSASVNITSLIMKKKKEEAFLKKKEAEMSGSY